MLKNALHALALRLENVADGLRARQNSTGVIEPYIGYATPEHMILRGRVLASIIRTNPKPNQSHWANFKQMLALFMTDEVSDVKITAEGCSTLSDEEGYFTLHLPRDHRKGWVNIEVSVPQGKTTTVCPVLIADPSAEFGVISDIDDTLLETGAYSLFRNLWTSLTGNTTTRRVFPDAVAFMNEVSKAGRNPVYFVSSSPWNMHGFINAVFDRAGLVKGPKFLRDLGLSQTQFITGTHGDHKGASIDAILAANPGLRFVLVGDTGQHDAFVYHDAILRHPDRIFAIVLREPGPGPDAKSKTAMHAIEGAGVLLLNGPEFGGFAEQLRKKVK